MSDNHEHDLFGTGLLGGALAPKRSGNLAERFIIPPFTVLSAREGWWQSRKRAWIALGIKSELGRGGEPAPEPGPDGHVNGAFAPQAPVVAPVVAAPRTPVAPPPATLAPAPTSTPSARPSAPAAAPKAVTISMPRRSYTAPVAAAPAAPRGAPYEDPFLHSIQPKLIAADGRPMRFDEDTWFDDPPRSAVGVDVECFVNFFCVCFKRFADGKRLAFERSRRRDFDPDLLQRVLAENVIVSFNGATYDLPMIYLAIAGRDTVSLKQTSQRIVSGHDIKPWNVERELGVTVPKLNHIDLIEPSPAVRQGLKIIHGRLHGRYVVDLPYDHDAVLTPDEMNVTTLYCFNDLDGTETLYRALREPLELRSALGKKYGGLDLRSKSDSQIGEALVKKRVEMALGQRLSRERPQIQTTFGYDPPEFLEFRDPTMRGVLDDLRQARFHLLGDKPQPPEFLKNLKVKLGDMSYSMGIGGLHSTESRRAIRADNQRALLDVDVASQYPNIIVKLGLYPPAMGPKFLDVYREMIGERLAAKDAGDKVMADGGKIMVNGVYGKLGSGYSPLYAPNILIATTLTGQLAVLMLIERAESAGIPVVSANTDGVIFWYDRGRQPELDRIIAVWEADTGFRTDRTPYAALYSRDVNTYIAVGEDGKVKRKGAIADPWTEGDLRVQMQKNPQMTVCSEALVRYITDGAPLAETIRAATDPRMFVTVTRVAAGATWRGHKLGRALRYYWSTDGDPIFAGGARKVANTDGARPMMELPDRLPEDVDYGRYVSEAIDLAVDLAILDRRPDSADLL